MSDIVLLEVEQGVATLSMNCPELFNAFGIDMADGLAKSLTALAVDESVKGVVITGEGKAFCAGGDLKWVNAFPGGPGAAFHILADRANRAVFEIRRMRKPVIAAINGVAAGGGFSLALACDFRVMERSAVLRQGYTSSGLCIDMSGTFMLPRLVGISRAMEIAAFDRPISAEQALGWGLANRVVDDGKAVEGALEMAVELAGRSLNAFGWAKKLITDSFDTGFEVQIELEREGIRATSEHPDGREGMTAFLEKRRPVFRRQEEG